MQLIDIHTLKNGIYDTSMKAVLLKNESIYQVRFPTISDIYFETQEQCKFVRAISQDVILLANYTKLWIAKQDVPHYVDSQIIEIEVYNNYILVVTQSKVHILYYDTSFENTNTTIDTQLLNKLIPQYNRTYQIIDIQFAQMNDIVLLDKNYGVIILEIIDITHFNLKYHHYYPSYKPYYQMDIAYFPSNYLIIASTQYSQIFVLSQKEFVSILSTFQVNYTLVHIAAIGLTSDQAYFVAYNTSYIAIYALQNGYRFFSREFENPVLMSFNHFLSTVYIVQQSIQQTYIISNGFLVMHPVLQPSHEYQQLQIIGTEDSQCAITINYIIYDYLDNSLYNKRNVYNQIRQFVNYPTYPQVSIFQQLGVTGSNVHASIKLNDDSISLKLGFLEEMNIEGIIWPDEMIYVNLYYASPLVYYLIQVKSLKTTLYQCQPIVISYQLKCQKVHDFNPNKELDNESFQWIDNSVITFGYISKFRHTIEIFQLKQSIVSKLFTISTSLKDENSAITSFTLTKSYVFVVLQQKQQICVYSFFDQKLIYIITEFDTKPYQLSPKFVRMSEAANQLIIVNDDTIFIGYYLHHFTLIEYLEFPNCRQIQVSLTTNTFFVALHYGYLQELREYSMRMKKVYLLKNIPLFHYILQDPIQMLSSLDLIVVRAYTPVLQQTVLLIYQPDVSLRESLLTHIPLESYLKDSLNLGITTYYYTGLLVHASSKTGIKNLFVYKNIQAVITSKWDDQYIHQKELTIYYDTIDSPETIEFVQNVTFLNLMTNIVAISANQTISINSIILTIPNYWFKGWIVDYKIECQQCQDLIILTQKIHQISTVNYNQQLLGQCKLENDFNVILTYSQLIFLDSQHFVKHQPFFFTLGPYLLLDNIWCRQNTIFLSGSTNTSSGFVQMIRYEDRQFRIIGDPFLIKLSHQLVQLELLDDGNFLVLDGTQYIGGYYYDAARLCAYHYEYSPPNHVSYTYTPCVDYKKHPEFYVSSFVVYKVKNVYRVILSDLSQGLFIQDFHYIDSTIKCIAADEAIFRVSLKQSIQQLLGLKIDREITFLKVVAYGEPLNNFQIFRVVLLTNSIAHLSLQLTFDDNIFQDVTIFELIQRYSDFNVLFDASMVQNYLALAYNYGTYTVCIYKLGSTSQPVQLKEPVLLMAGIEFQAYTHFFSLICDDNGQLLLQINKDYMTMNLYRIEEFVTLTFLEDAAEQQIVLTAQNQLTSASLILNVELNSQIATNVYWVLVIILFVFIFLLLIIAVVVFLRNHNIGKQKKTTLSKKALMN